MKKRAWKRGLAVVLGLLLGVQTPCAGLVPAIRSYAYTERSATINASTLNVRSGPGTNTTAVTKLARGTAVTVINETTGSDGRLWYQIRFTANGSTSTGYVLNTYVKFPVTYSPSADFEAHLNAQGFPESYKDGLRQLHAQFPNWVFEAQKTGLDWNTVIQNEMVLPRSLVHTNSISSYKSLADGAYNWDTSTWTGFDGSTWVAASEGLLSYYMDPRNFFDQVYMFQFLDHTYNPSLQTREGLQELIKGTFLEKAVIVNGIGAGSTDSSTGSTSSGGPGVVSGGSGDRSGGVIVSPSGGKGAGGGSLGPSGVSASPSGGSAGVQFGAPQASVSKKKTELVTTGAAVVVGAMPGADGSGTQTGAAPSDQGQTPQVSDAPGSSNTTSPSPSVTPGGTENPGEQTSASYVDIIMKAAEESGVNPYVLAAMIIQEQGSDARGRSISGTVSGYGGYYNYFNVGAYADNGMSAVERGLWYASQSGSYGRPWNTPEKAIIGGAQFYGTNYVKAGQDTFYLKKYNVQGSNMYKHQYMTNVDGAAAEASLFAEAYSQNLKQSVLHFKIPVYNNMPDTPCAKPTGSGSPNNKLRSLGADGFALTPTFNCDTTSYDLIVDYSVSDVNIYANVIDSTASVSGTGNVSLQSGNNEIRVQVKAENGSVREYVIHVVRQNNGPTYNGSLSGGTSPAGTTPSQGSTGVVGPGMSGSGSSGPGVSSSPSGGGAGVVTPGGNGGTSPTPGGSNVTVVSPAG